jgi:hypothetical protein
VTGVQTCALPIFLNINENIEGKWGPCVRFVFKIVGGDYDNATASVLAKDDWSPGSKLDDIIRALGVEPLEFGENFDSENLKGKRALIYIESDEKDGKIHNNVTKYRAVKIGTPVAKPAAPSASAAPAAPVAPATPPAQPQTSPVATGVHEVKEPTKTPTGVNIVEEINF